MQTSLALLLGVAAVAVLLLTINAIRKKVTKKPDEKPIKICKECQNEIPLDFSKSLCPHCKAFLT
ncbi:hypothetical protein QA612_10720 [Evansella sp. AB-P1]|uniref:hypothetical protein n=1 Tax=Evansella sp. AB-P1 TaxID=3037653 RepID=UPI00241C6E51|nr:hypothetical protein [Evansella sp. AB-P1]MDG5787961.1 hypothetical protein [Evansella sp. AB-P1]